MHAASSARSSRGTFRRRLRRPSSQRRLHRASALLGARAAGARAGVRRGYTIVIWRGRHVAEPTELTEDEAARFWLEVVRVGRAIEEHLEPVKMNYDILGNSLPHLHAHLVPRYADDPRPEWPFPFPDEEASPIDQAAFEADVTALRRLLS